MGSFVAPNSPAPAIEPDDTITNHPFFPDLSVLAFRTTMRVDQVITTERATESLYQAMLEVNQRLTAYATEKQDLGYNTLALVPVVRMAPSDANTRLYLRAVYSLARADVAEKYRDYDTTNEGLKGAELLDPAIAEHRRNAAWAIRDLEGKSRTTIELI